MSRSAQMAIPRGHSTARMAGAFAAQCQASALLLTHFRHLPPPRAPARARRCRFWPSLLSSLECAQVALPRLVLCVSSWCSRAFDACLAALVCSLAHVTRRDMALLEKQGEGQQRRVHAAAPTRDVSLSHTRCAPQPCRGHSEAGAATTWRFAPSMTEVRVPRCDAL